MATELNTRAPETSGSLHFAGFTLDVAGCTLAAVGGREVPLRRSEFALLLAFVRTPGRVLSRDHLLDAVAGRQYSPYDRSVDVLVSRLRRKLEPDPEAPRLILTVPGLGYKFMAKPQPVQTHVEELQDSRMVAPTWAPEKPSIAVLPFQNMSGDPGQDYLADSITEEIITALSRIPSFSVIARHSTFAYKGAPLDVRQIGRELGVRYVLEGSVRKAGDRMRIAGQLVETGSGVHLWADRFDRPISDIFDAQDRLTASVVGAIEPKLRQAEIDCAQRKAAGNLQAYDMVQRSRFVFTQQTREALEESCRLLQRAVELDPNYALALAWLTRARFSIDAQHLRFSTAAEVDGYVRMAQRAIESGRDDPEVLVVASLVIALPGGDLPEAIALVDQALALNRNSAEAWAMSGMLYAHMGESETALDRLDRSVQLSPLNLWVSWQIAAFVLAHFAAGHYDDALVWAERALRRYASHVVFLKYKAATLGLLGRTNEAQEVVHHLRAVVPGLTLSQLLNVKAILYKHSIRWPAVHQAQYEGLRRAGLPA